MMIEEFEKRTGFYPTLVQYEAIERAYMDFDGDKDAFCKAYKRSWSGSRSGSPTRIPTTSPRSSTPTWPRASPAAQRVT